VRPRSPIRDSPMRCLPPLCVTANDDGEMLLVYRWPLVLVQRIIALRQGWRPRSGLNAQLAQRPPLRYEQVIAFHNELKIHFEDNKVSRNLCALKGLQKMPSWFCSDVRADAFRVRREAAAIAQ
jgi:hypothetical protein